MIPNLTAHILMKLVVLDEIEMSPHDLCLCVRRLGLQSRDHLPQLLGQAVNMLLEAIQFLLDAGGPPLIGAQQREIALQKYQTPACRSRRKHFAGESMSIRAGLIVIHWNLLLVRRGARS